MLFKTRAAIVLATIPAFLVATSNYAHATVVTVSCTSGGFTGYMQLTDKFHPKLYYNIQKGSNSGGNKANIYVSDAGLMPTLNLANNDNGVQDGQWHLYYGPYARGGGWFTVKFVFDKSNAGDPSCTKSQYIG
ncbi:MAG: hypothetical protein QOG53_867 [Frankiales bacterium]|jgi:hypothetical protein|nr:hypothetical protein [Frankiales bacterium]